MRHLRKWIVAVLWEVIHLPMGVIIVDDHCCRGSMVKQAMIKQTMCRESFRALLRMLIHLESWQLLLQ